MTKKNAFFKNGALLSAVAVAARTVGIFFNAFVTSTVGASGMGEFTLIMTVYGFGLTFATAGIGLTVTRLTAGAIGEKKEEEIPRIVGKSALYAGVFSLFGALVLFAFAPFIGGRILGDARTVSPLRVLAVSLPFSALCVVISGYFTALRRVALNASVQVLGQGAKILLTVRTVGTVAAFGAERAVLFLCTLSTLTEILLAFALLLLYLSDKTYKTHKNARARFPLSRVAAVTLPLAFSAYIRSALVTAEHVLIPKCLLLYGQTQEAALASYGVLHGMVIPLLLYPMAGLSSFAGLLVPEFAESFASRDGARMARICSRALGATLTFGIGVGVFLRFFSEELSYAVYHSYEAGVYTGALAFVIPIMYLDHVTDAILKGIGEQVYSMWVNISDAALSVLLVLLLLPRVGILGYALVIAVMEAYNFVLSFWRLRRKIKFKLPLLRTVLPPLSAGLCAVFLCRLAFCGNFAEPFWLAMKLVFAAALFVSFLILFRALFPKKLSASGKKQLLF